MEELLRNEVVFVRLINKKVVSKIKTDARYGSPEWNDYNKQNHELAAVLNTAGIKFALSSLSGTFSIMVNGNDSDVATKLLEEKLNHNN